MERTLPATPMPSRAPQLAPQPSAVPATEEALVADPRAALTPAQMVERKLDSLLNSQPLPVSHLTATRPAGRRR